MAKRTLQENINQVLNDLNEIKSAIELKGVEVPAGTPTRDYGDKILEIEGGIDTSADTVTPESLRAGFTAHDAQGRQIEGAILTYDNTMVAAPSKENFFGKWYFNEIIDLSIVTGKTILEFSHPFVYGDTHSAKRIRLNEKGSPLSPYSYATIDYIDGMIFKVYGSSGGWDHERYRNIDFGTTPFEIDETWYEFFTTNATYVGKAMALNTAKKYCENNIDVSPIYNEGIEAGINSIPRYDGSIIEGAVEGAQIKYDEGFADGKKAWMDTYLDNANKAKNVSCLFAGYGWTIDNFKPTKSLSNFTNATQMFYSSAINGDVSQALSDCGVVFDFSQCDHFGQTFAYSRIRRLGVINAVKASGNALNSTFVSAVNLHTIDKLCLHEKRGYASTFNNCTNLQNLTIEGTIGQNGFDVSWSPLSKTSLTSVVNALSSTTTGLTVTLRLDAVNTEFETSTGAADGSTSDEWLALAATKPNWAINLINS